MIKKLFENGYVVIPNLVPKTLLDDVIGDIVDILEIPNVVDPMGMVELYHTQSMWDVRQHPNVHEVFSLILKNEKLWTSIDRINYKPPTNGVVFDDGFIHWDVCVNRIPKLTEFQGVLTLTDTDEDMGGFQCVTSLYREFEEWKELLSTKKVIYSHFDVVGEEATEFIPATFPKRKPKRWKIERIPAKAGDLIIWDSLLAHGNAPNRGKDSRLAQYVTMTPVGDERLRRERIDCWKNDKPPYGYAFPGNPNINCREEPAELTELGRKLLGVDSW